MYSQTDMSENIVNKKKINLPLRSKIHIENTINLRNIKRNAKNCKINDNIQQKQSMTCVHDWEREERSIYHNAYIILWVCLKCKKEKTSIPKKHKIAYHEPVAMNKGKLEKLGGFENIIKTKTKNKNL